MKIVVAIYLVVDDEDITELLSGGSGETEILVKTKQYGWVFAPKEKIGRLIFQ